MTRSPLELTAGATATLAGMIHLLVAPSHWQHAPAHGLFFAVAGLIELLWGGLLLRRPSRALLQAGVILAGGLIVLWVLTRGLPAPFGHGPEPLELGGVVCKLAEAVALASVSLILFRRTAAQHGVAAARRSLGALLGVALAVGFTTYIAGLAAEPILPRLERPRKARHHHQKAGRPPLELPISSSVIR